MVRQHFGRTALALMAVVALGATALSGDLVPTKAGDKKPRTETKVTAKADKPGSDGKQTLVVTLEVNPGWHAYANPVGNDEFKANATIIKVSAKNKLESVQVSYPVGKLKQDKLVGEYRYYEGKTEIPVVVQRAKGDSSPLEVSVSYSTCHFKTMVCLPAEQVKLTLP